MLRIGAHMSVAGGYEKMGRQVLEMGANTLQFFTRNPRGMRKKPIDYRDLSAFEWLMERRHCTPFVAHAPYTVNGCSKEERVRRLAFDIVREDLKNMECLPGNYYNLHPGSHLGQGAGTGCSQTADMLNAAMFDDMHTTVLLETMAGKGTEIGRTFRELRDIWDRIERKKHLGICMDMCHMWDAGYDVSGNLEGVLEEFDHTIGLQHVKAVHINDSMNQRGAGKDRHTTIGDGYIGKAAIVKMLTYPAFQGIPFILETPVDPEQHAEEIRELREAYAE